MEVTPRRILSPCSAKSATQRTKRNSARGGGGGRLEKREWRRDQKIHQVQDDGFGRVAGRPGEQGLARVRAGRAGGNGGPVQITLKEVVQGGLRPEAKGGVSRDTKRKYPSGTRRGKGAHERHVQPNQRANPGSQEKGATRGVQKA